MRRSIRQVIITVKGLTKTFRKYQTESEGFASYARNLLFRKYEEKAAVDAVSFQIEPGTCVGILGANGAGKTTLIKMLCGLLVPTKGEASVLGFTPWDREDDFLKQVGVVMGQRQQLWIDVSTMENLQLNRVIYDISEDEFRARVKLLAEILGVEKLLDTQIRKLSLGEKMKMELMAAFLHKPKLLFLDEPTLGLDVVAQSRIREFIKDRVKSDGVTVLLTSHYMKDLEELCPRALLIQHGKLMHDGPLEGISEKISGVRRIRWHTVTPMGGEIAGKSIQKSSNEGEYFIEAMAREVPRIVKELVQGEGIDDLNIETPPLEEAIRDIFEAKSPREI